MQNTSSGPESIDSEISHPAQLWRAMMHSPWLAPLIFGGLFLVLYADVLFGDLVISYRDMLFVYLPTRMHFANRLLNGELPEWYPFDGLGSSYIGNVVTALLHPTILLHLILPHPLALNLSVVLMHYVATLGAFFLLRHWYCGRTAALIGGLAFSLSGYMMSMDGNLLYLCAGAAIPWAVFGIERMSIPLTGAAMALMAFSGDPQALYFTSIFLFFCAITRQAPSNKLSLFENNVNGLLDSIKSFFKDRTRQKAMIVLAVSGVIALLASAAQLLPAIFASEVRDSGEAALRANRVWSLNPLRLLGLWSPGVIRLPDGNTPDKLFSQEDIGAFWADSLYVGAAVLALAVIALRFSRQRRVCRLLAGLGTLTLMVALGAGHHAPAYEALQHWLPGFSLLRYPEKTFVFVTFAAAMLAGIGADCFIENHCKGNVIARRSRQSFGRGLLLFVLMNILMIVLIHSKKTDRFLLILAGAAPEAYAELEQARISFESILLNGAAFSLVSLIFLIWSRWGQGRMFKPLLCFAVLGPVIAGTLGINHSYREAGSLIFESPHVVERLQELNDNLPFYGQLRLYTHFEESKGLAQFRNVHPNREKKSGDILRSRMQNLTLGINGIFNLENAVGYMPITASGRLADILDLLNDTIFLNGFNVRAAQELAEKPPSLDRLFKLLLNPNAGDRIRLVQGIPVETTDEAIEVANRPHFDSVKVVPVETNDAGYPTEAPQAGKVKVVTYSPEYIDVKFYSETATTLFVADAFADGWRARVDGEEVPIYPGLIAGRAIPVPAGEHRVELTYKTPGLRVGLVLSAIGWLAIIALAIGSRWRRRKKPNGEVVAA